MATNNTSKHLAATNTAPINPLKISGKSEQKDQYLNSKLPSYSNKQFSIQPTLNSNMLTGEQKNLYKFQTQNTLKPEISLLPPVNPMTNFGNANTQQYHTIPYNMPITDFQHNYAPNASQHFLNHVLKEMVNKETQLAFQNLLNQTQIPGN